MLEQEISEVQRDFYDGLYLQSLFQWDTKKRIRSGERDLPRIDIPRRRIDWQIFLDDICLLCDSCPGGAATTAIAVAQGSKGTTFWISSDFSVNKRLRSYVTRLLHMIRLGAHRLSVAVPDTTRIFQEAVRRSPRRVENYAGRLTSALGSPQASDVAEQGGIEFPRGDDLEKRPELIIRQRATYERR